jgi:hypothetical protein
MRAHGRVLVTRGAGTARTVSTARASLRPCAPATAEEAAISCERGWDGRSPDIAAAFLRVRLRRDGFLVVGSCS